MDKHIEDRFWSKSKSATLSLICTRALIVLFAAIAIALPFLVNGRPFYSIGDTMGSLFFYLSYDMALALYVCAYACFVPLVIALFSLDLFLRNIRKDLVFIRPNVKYLRIISWCCFIIAIIMLCCWPSLSNTLPFVAAAAAFFGLLMRVVKNVIEAACEIKDENDFTI